MSDIESYESDQELALYREYRDVVKIFRYVVETERRILRGQSQRCVGVGYLPHQPLRPLRPDRHLQRRQRRRTQQAGHHAGAGSAAVRRRTCERGVWLWVWVKFFPQEREMLTLSTENSAALHGDLSSLIL